ncbi:MAG: type IV secretion system protein [Pseudomonadota bacterium]
MQTPLNPIQQRAIELRINRFAVISAAVITYLVFFIPTAFAGDYSDYGDAHTAFGTFLDSVEDLLDAVLAPGSNAAAFIEAFFLFGVIYKLVTVIAKYMLLAGELIDVFQAIILIAIVRALLDFYGPVTSALFSWSGDFASAIQEPIVGTGDVFFVTEYIQNIIAAITHEDTSIWDGIKIAFATMLLSGTLLILSILAFFAVAWAVWGFALSKLIGWMFIPFLLFERTAFLFDGWLRFMVGFLLYAVIARVNLVLVLVLFASYFGLPLDSPVGPDRAFPIPNVDEIGGLLSLLIIAILSLISTGRFATALAGGVGGFGQAVGTIARTAALGFGGAARRAAATSR